MKNRFFGLTIVATLICLNFPVISLAADLRSQMLANPCLSCHGPDTRSAGSIPPVVGMTSENIKAALLAFKKDERIGTVMNRIAKGYTDEEIDELARYFTH